MLSAPLLGHPAVSGPASFGVCASLDFFLGRCLYMPLCMLLCLACCGPLHAGDTLRTGSKEQRQYWVVNFSLSPSLQDYPEGNNSSDYLVQTTTYLPQNFTYSPNLPCPEKLPYMRKCELISFDGCPVLYKGLKTTWFEHVIRWIIIVDADIFTVSHVFPLFNFGFWRDSEHWF